MGGVSAARENAYLNQRQLKFFEEQLSNWRQSVCRLLAEACQARNAEPPRQPDWIDSAALSTQAELSWAKRERALRTLKEIDAALDRIQDGTYGYCCASGEEIGLNRLKAFPIARFSVAEQEALEQRNRMFR